MSDKTIMVVDDVESNRVLLKMILEDDFNIVECSSGQECLDHFIAFGEKHLNYLVSEYIAHYHLERPHQSLGNEPVLKIPRIDEPPDQDDSPLAADPITCQTRLGGLLKHYHRAAT